MSPPLPQRYFDVICCPRCHGDLSHPAAATDTLECAGCRAGYPVVDGVPILLVDADDQASSAIRQFYSNAWKRDEQQELRARVLHNDLSDLGERYATIHEQAFERYFDGGGRYFLDAACGALPRVSFGKHFAHHVCLDFSLDGLIECRRVLGERAITVCGSVLKMPLKTSLCDGVLAAHCIYHVEKERQHEAVAEMSRVLAAGRVVIFYANPDALERKIIRGAKRVMGRGGGSDAPQVTESFYYYAHPIDRMLSFLRDEFPDGAVSVLPLRLVSTTVSARAFRVKVLGPAFFHTLRAVEKLAPRNARPARLVAYVVDRPARR
ncbi:MAG TPA: methyltransferase domain-containing protein [Candidatus Krumholzibacteria bacterium]|nr:methyltransferase domain-containing protein [Candidatus Krumholzibacteria bacterium]